MSCEEEEEAEEMVGGMAAEVELEAAAGVRLEELDCDVRPVFLCGVF